MVTKRQLQIALKSYKQTENYYYVHIDDLTEIVNKIIKAEEGKQA